MSTATTLPEGLRYMPGFLTEAEEHDALVERWSITFRTLRHPAGGAR